MPSMTIYQPGDLVLVAFPFSTGDQTKNRPALVLLDAGDADIVAARVTTQLQQTAYDVMLAQWKAAGLLAPSIVRLHKLATLAKARVHRPLGKLDSSDRQKVAASLTRLFTGW